LEIETPCAESAALKCVEKRAKEGKAGGLVRCVDKRKEGSAGGLRRGWLVGVFTGIMAVIATTVEAGLDDKNQEGKICTTTKRGR
jgi:hypothetical protein